eukprot:scaffold1170_cov174-Amphora_coffeaeformis.AAC.14
MEQFVLGVFQEQLSKVGGAGSITHISKIHFAPASYPKPIPHSYPNTAHNSVHCWLSQGASQCESIKWQGRNQRCGIKLLRFE